MDPGLVSVVIPTLNEERALPACLDFLAREEGPLEVIVADGGSEDRTRQIAETREGVRVVDAPPGRSRQMNRGAEVARGEVLWFLHADSRPEPGALATIRAILASRGTAIGAFRFRLDGERAVYRLLEFGVWLRVLLFRNPYGDQGLFLRTRDFRELGGFEDIPLFEDVRLVRAMRARGRLRVSPLAIATSPRRWEAHGVWRTTRMHLRLAILERLGTPVEELARRRRAGGEPRG